MLFDHKMFDGRRLRIKDPVFVCFFRRLLYRRRKFACMEYALWTPPWATSSSDSSKMTETAQSFAPPSPSIHLPRFFTTKSSSQKKLNTSVCRNYFKKIKSDRGHTHSAYVRVKR